MKKRKSKKAKQRFYILVFMVVLLVARQEFPVFAETLQGVNNGMGVEFSLKENRTGYDEEYFIVTESESVELNLINPRSVSFNLEQDSYVVFSANSAAFWGLDEIVERTGSESIYLTSPQKFFLKKGKHYMYLLQTSNANTEYVNLTYTIYPVCKVYSLNGENVECIAEYALQESSQKMNIPQKSFEGCTFEGWYEEKDYKTQITFVDKSIGKDWYIYPKLTPIVYKITYELDGGENNIANPMSFTVNDNRIDLKPALKEGYVFEGWYTDPAFMKPVDKIDTKVCKDFIVYAKWKKNIIVPTPEPENTEVLVIIPTPEPGNTEVPIVTPEPKPGSTEAPTVTPKPEPGNTSVPVKENGTGYDEEYSIVTESESVELNLINPRSVSFNLEQDSYVVFSANSAAFWGLDEIVERTGSESIYLTSPQKFFLKKGKHYMYLLQTSNANTEYVNLTYTIYPVCKVYSLNGENVECIAEYALQESSQKMNIPQKSFEGCTFEGWYEEKDYKTQITFVDKSIGKDWYIYPKLTPIVYKITYELDGGENNIANPMSFTVNDNRIDLKPALKEGYVFEGWYTDPAFMKPVDKIDTKVCKDFIVYAKWKKNIIVPTPEPENTEVPVIIPTPEPGNTEAPEITPEPVSVEKDVMGFHSKEVIIYPCEMAVNYILIPKNIGQAKNWKSEDKKIVKIKKSYVSGKVKFVGLKEGKTKITASIGGITYGFDIIVKNPKAFKLKNKKIVLKSGGYITSNSYKTHSKNADGYDKELIKITILNTTLQVL